MPYPRPTLADLIDQAQQDLNASIPGADSRLKYGFLFALSGSEAGMAHVLLGYIAWAVRQAFTDTAEAEYLVQEGDNFGLPKQPPQAAIGPINVVGSNGSAIPVDSLWQRQDGVQYRVTVATLVAGGLASCPAVCVITGVIGNAPSGTQVSAVSPLPGVQSAATTGVMAGGAELESDERLRQKILLRKRQPPQGGNFDDYTQWGLRLPGLTRIWPDPNADGLNTMRIRFMMDDTYPNGIPTSGDAANLLALLQPLVPVTLSPNLVVTPPIAQPQNYSIQLLPDAPETRLAVEAELRDLIRRDATPGGTLLISRQREAISIATGESDHVMVSPTANVTATSDDHIHTFGSITWL
jgi:uncharacterized phage protein gp47/JayE